MTAVKATRIAERQVSEISEKQTFAALNHASRRPGRRRLLKDSFSRGEGVRGPERQRREPIIGHARPLGHLWHRRVAVPSTDATGAGLFLPNARSYVGYTLPASCHCDATAPRPLLRSTKTVGGPTSLSHHRSIANTSSTAWRCGCHRRGLRAVIRQPGCGRTHLAVALAVRAVDALPRRARCAQEDRDRVRTRASGRRRPCRADSHL
jgi:hypothetical protein